MVLTPGELILDKGMEVSLFLITIFNLGPFLHPIENNEESQKAIGLPFSRVAPTYFSLNLMFKSGHNEPKKIPHRKFILSCTDPQGLQGKIILPGGARERLKLSCKTEFVAVWY